MTHKNSISNRKKGLSIKKGASVFKKYNIGSANIDNLEDSDEECDDVDV